VAQAGDDGLRRVADCRLHLAIATVSGSVMLIEAVTQAQSRLAELLAGDGERARTVMDGHCDAASALLRGLIG
jgi:GntR family transcriptional repressor for pyruvate dehydrogenase complex